MNFVEIAERVLLTESEAILGRTRDLDEGFARIVNFILTKKDLGKVVIRGIVKSGHIGRKIAATLSNHSILVFIARFKDGLINIFYLR
jgi:arabinose-5-phosphate isomerase